MKKINRKIYEILFVFISSLTPLLWFAHDQIILGHDSGFRLDPIKQLGMLFYSWNPANNFGADWTFFKGFLVIQFPEAMFTALTHSVWLGQRITLVFWFFLMGISMYYCLNYFFSKKDQVFIRIFGTLLYTYNFFILQGWFIAERAKFSLYAALPLGFVILYASLKREMPLKKGTFLFAILFLLLNGGGNLPLFGGVFIAYGVLIGYELLISLLKKKWKNILHIFKTVAIFLLATILVNAYWVAQQIFLLTHSFNSSLASTGGIDGILGWESVISKHASILNLLRLEGIPDWYDNAFHPYSHSFLTNPLLILVSFLPFFVIVLGFLVFKVKKTKLIYPIFFVFFVSVVFSGGTHPPTGVLYEFLMKHLPGFVIFRSSYYKFAPALLFSLSILIAFYLEAFISLLSKGKKKVAYVIVAFIFLYFNFPYFTTDFFSFNKPFTTKVTLPQYATDMSSYINMHVDPSKRILLLPDLDPNLGSDSYTWGYWSLDVLPRVLTNNNFISSDSNSNMIRNMYQAIHEKNEPVFLDIARRLGIQKVLWRGDILYSDKLTKAEDIIGYKNSLESFQSVKLEKSIGEWRLYTIVDSDSLSLFSSVKDVSQVASNVLRYEDVGSLTSADSSVWITQQQGQVSQDILDYVLQEVIGTPCESCTLNAIDHQRQQLAMPATVSLLPWSRFYFLITKKENNLIKQTQTFPNQRIDADLSFENTRLVEIWKMAFKDFNKNAAQYIGENKLRYEALVNDSLSQLDRLSGQQRNDYIVRLLAYLKLQRDYIQYFNENDLIKKDINDILAFIDKTTYTLQKEVWVSTGNEERKSYVSIPNGGKYTVKVSPLDDVLSINFNGVQTNNLNTLPLEKGDDTIEVQYKPQGNLIEKTEETVSLKKGEQIVMPINEFNYNNSYYFHFTYKVEKGGYIKFVINQNNKNNEWKNNLANPFIVNLISDGQSHMISDTYTPYIGASKANVLFVAQRDSVINLSEMTVQNLISPSILFIEKRDAKKMDSPRILYQKIDPTAYIVTVSNATSPWLMQFNQAFNKGWRVYITSEKMPQPNWLFVTKGMLFGKQVSEQDHVLLNDYSNGWYINKTGSYTLFVTFIPQNYFYIGILISVITIIILGGFYVYKNKK